MQSPGNFINNLPNKGIALLALVESVKLSTDESVASLLSYILVMCFIAITLLTIPLRRML